MEDFVSNFESSEDPFSGDAPPEFGLVDIVEAFTAMRHDWRGQTKESRAVVESIHAAVNTIQELEASLLAQTAASSSNESRKLVELIADMDHQLTRSVEATARLETNRQAREEADAHAIERYFDGMSALGRWFARPLYSFVVELRRGHAQTAEHAAVEGLSLVVARLRRMMKEQHIERVETLGEAFDASTMNAIGTVDSQDHPSGHVAEQLSPCYRWQGRLLRFADVRVSAQRAARGDSSTPATV